MRTRIALLFLACATAGILAAASTVIRKVPVTSTAPQSGVEMFNTYCASCHGVSGRGDGPAAAGLKKVPADLTQLAARHNGKFPELEVYNAIVGEQFNTVHGSVEMPVWSDILKSLDNNSNLMVSLRLSNLTDYVKSLQRK